MRRHTQEEPEEDAELFFAVWLTWDYTRVEYWPRGFRPRYPGDGTLVIERDQRREPAMTYNRHGWVKAGYLKLRPSSIPVLSRGDRSLP